MLLTASNIGKRFNREWIFRGVNHAFAAGKGYAITGPNGSGKSTLLQVLAGATLQTEGQVTCTIDGQQVAPEKLYLHLAMAAPYLELPEEMTALELLRFHGHFKPLCLPFDEALAQVGLAKAAHKQIRYFSSGMKQRLKLAQAIFSQVPLLLLDEPCTNLDAEGIALYQRLMTEHATGKLILVSSNDPQEYRFCGEVLRMDDCKPYTAFV
jgi:ABC-type multidrug transport system ATPase subunit